MSQFDEAFARLDAFVEHRMQAFNIPGMALALTDLEGLMRVSTYGYADLAARTPVAPEHLFEIQSVTKSFTSILLLQLHEAGQLDLHAPVTDYLPWFKVESPYGPITPHHLMSHTSGIIRGAEYSPDKRFEIWGLRDTAIAAAPGEFFWYSNIGYKTLGQLLETILRQDYGDILRERILDPLGMRATDPIVTHATRPRMAVGYQTFNDDRPNRCGGPLAPATWAELNTADTSIASTAEDMATYLRLLLNRGVGPRGRIMSEASFARMTQPVIDVGLWTEGTSYGYGVVVGEVDGYNRLGHGGGGYGYLSSMLANLDNGIGAIVLMNAPVTNSHQFGVFALELLGAARTGRDLPLVPPLPDPLHIPNARDYTGRYTTGGQTLTVIADSERLYLQPGPSTEKIALEGRAWDLTMGWGPDALLASHPDFELFLLQFGRQIPGDISSPVVELCHGPDCYTREEYSAPATLDYPQRWDAYPGHYRFHQPDGWISNFRVVLRRGRLLMIAAVVGLTGMETPLVELDAGVFRIGEDERIPERIRFDTIVDGQAFRANVSGADYYRFFTP